MKRLHLAEIVEAFAVERAVALGCSHLPATSWVWLVSPLPHFEGSRDMRHPCGSPNFRELQHQKQNMTVAGAIHHPSSLCLSDHQLRRRLSEWRF